MTFIQLNKLSYKIRKKKLFITKQFVKKYLNDPFYNFSL